MFHAEEYKKELSESVSITDCKKVPLPQIGENQNYIFISYSHLDYKKVYADLAELYARGVRFWYDKGLCAGKEWDSEVQAKIQSENCVGVIFYMSENLFQSESANKEIQLTYDASSDESTGAKKNYFSVNLTDRSPTEILFHTIQMAGKSLTMQHIHTLTSAFSDKATYLNYCAPDYLQDLISQIEMQFGVIDKNGSDNIVLEADASPCDTLILPFPAVQDNWYRETAKTIASFLTKAGQTVYIAEEAHAQSEDYNSFIVKQCIGKWEQCKHVILVAPSVGVVGYEQEICAFLSGDAKEKKVLFCVESDFLTRAHPALKDVCFPAEAYGEALQKWLGETTQRSKTSKETL